VDTDVVGCLLDDEAPRLGGDLRCFFLGGTTARAGKSPFIPYCPWRVAKAAAKSLGGGRYAAVSAAVEVIVSAIE
jgi:hypothetical protein